MIYSFERAHVPHAGRNEAHSKPNFPAPWGRLPLVLDAASVPARLCTARRRIRGEQIPLGPRLECAASRSASHCTTSPWTFVRCFQYIRALYTLCVYYTTSLLSFTIDDLHVIETIRKHLFTEHL